MVDFINTFCSYLVLMLVIVAVAAVGFTIGLFLKKLKNKEQAEIVEAVNEVDNVQ